MKGKKSWKPSALLDTHDIPAGYLARWVDATDEANWRRKQKDGWVPISEVKNAKTGHVRPEKIEDGQPLSTVTQYRESVLCVIPEEDYREHRKYFREQTRRQTAGLRQKAERENAAKAQRGMTANLYGKTTIIE